MVRGCLLALGGPDEAEQRDHRDAATRPAEVKGGVPLLVFGLG
jgi:hypothetical protein